MSDESLLAPFDLHGARIEAANVAREREQARTAYKKHAREAAKLESEYRQETAKAFAGRRAQGEPAGAAEIYARATAAPKRLARDMAEVNSKAAQLRIAALEGDRAMLRVFSEWSQRLEGLPQPQWSQQQ